MYMVAQDSTVRNQTLAETALEIRNCGTGYPLWVVVAGEEQATFIQITEVASCL